MGHPFAFIANGTLSYRLQTSLRTRNVLHIGKICLIEQSLYYQTKQKNWLEWRLSITEKPPLRAENHRNKLSNKCNRLGNGYMLEMVRGYHGQPKKVVLHCLNRGTSFRPTIQQMVAFAVDARGYPLCCNFIFIPQ